MKKAIFSVTLLFLITNSLFAETERTLLITGFAKVGIPAELVEIRIGVETEAKTAEEAHEKTAQRQIKSNVAFNTIVLRSKIEQSGKLIDDAIQSGANQILGIRLLPSETNSEKATLEAFSEKQG